jgi:hypothetical protein
MKRFFFLFALLSLCAPATLCADGATLDATLTAWGVDAAAANDASIYPALIPAINCGYGVRMSGYALKFGLAAEDALINYSGAVPASPKQAAEFITAGKAEPYAELALGGLSVHIGVPLYYFTPFSSPSTDQNGIKNGLKWMYKGIGLQYYTSYAAGSTGAFNIANNSNANDNTLWGNYDKISYKIAITNQFSIVPAVEADFIFVPALAFADIKPSGDSYFNGYIVTFDPKLTFGFEGLGVKGLKVFASSSIPITTEYYNNKGLNLIPGIGYKANNVSVEADLRMNYLDYAVSDGTNYKQTEYDPYVRATYTFNL